MFKRRQLLACGLGVLAASLLPAGTSRAGEEKKHELVILIWSDYLDPEVVKIFEERAKVTLRQVFFDSDQERDQQVVRKGSDAFDVLIVNGITLPFYGQQKWLTPLDKSRMTHLAHLDPGWLAEGEHSGRLLGVPYLWGNIGLAYREDLVPNPPTGWLDFFRPVEALRGRLNAIATNRELFGIALKALGHSVNSEEPGALAEAEALLLRQKPYVRSYPYLDIGKESPLVTGEVAMAMVYNGDALKLHEYHPKIRYLNPREGSAMWVDFMAVGTNAARRDLALAFIDFMQEPAMAGKNAQFLHFATPNQEALRLAPIAYRTDPVIFPTEEVSRLSETIRPVSSRTQRKINDVVARLTR
ncbi:MAG: spermidine/putrescine ABC transporter substrate-binding protein [Magnetococcales bacterium]|nr:spermidine/putrescine ABC transporter substrate-binding protein [Magnetococcales bacterium]